MSVKNTGENETFLTIQALQRMPYYLHCLEEAKAEGVKTISATSIANKLQLNDVLVRKDIGAVASVIAGAGSLGTALLRNDEFEEYGLSIAAAFDVRPELVGTKINGIPVCADSELTEFCLERGIRLGVITAPKDSAQKIADAMVSGGIRAIWNFALIKLTVPEGIMVQNENLASSLAMLSHHISK